MARVTRFNAWREGSMDATRARRGRDRARRIWYARHRQWRFARYLGFADVGDDLR
jgi:hypothetical protein